MTHDLTPRAMAPDTKSKMIQTWLAIGAAVVGFITWQVKLESKVGETDRVNAKQDAEISALKSDTYASRDRLTRIESDMRYIAGGIEEIKQTLKQQNRNESK